MVLFWHQVFATGQSKIDNWHELINQADMLREKGMGNYRDLLVALAKNPAMIYWLDNCDNHGHAVNENWGRELLELFSLGVGMDGHPNYTETDVREASRAFTGWTIAQPPRGYYNRWDWEFEYLEEDHDDGEKTFLGHTGNFDGEDIIDIIVQQPSCHRFIARHLYNFFVADEAQVPAWMTTPPRDPEAVDTIARAFADSHYDMRSTLRVLFLSDFFKNARFAKIKSPAEVVVGLMRLAGGFEFPGPGIGNLSKNPTYMGQELLNPPSVEGWHTVLSGSTAAPDEADQLRCRSLGGCQPPGHSRADFGSRRKVTCRQRDSWTVLPGPHWPAASRAGDPPEPGRARQEGGVLRWGTEQEVSTSSARVGEMLQLIASVREFQYA